MHVICCSLTPPSPPTSRVIPPSVLWAQRNDTLFVTVSLTDIKNERFTLDEHKFTFRGVGGPDEKQYACEIQFLKEVVPQVGDECMSGRRRKNS